MARAVLVVYSQPRTDAQDREYNEWYDHVHIPQVLERIPGVRAAARYRISATQLVEQESCPQRRYLTIYEVEADDLPAVRDRLAAALSDDTFDWSEALDMSDLSPVAHFYEPAH